MTCEKKHQLDGLEKYVQKCCKEAIMYGAETFAAKNAQEKKLGVAKV